jgi:hypothetical protein
MIRSRLEVIRDTYAEQNYSREKITPKQSLFTHKCGIIYDYQEKSPAQSLQGDQSDDRL